jgi:hypothetical protein
MGLVTMGCRCNVGRKSELEIPGHFVLNRNKNENRFWS